MKVKAKNRFVSFLIAFLMIFSGIVTGFTPLTAQAGWDPDADPEAYGKNVAAGRIDGTFYATYRKGDYRGVMLVNGRDTGTEDGMVVGEHHRSISFNAMNISSLSPIGKIYCIEAGTDAAGVLWDFGPDGIVDGRALYSYVGEYKNDYLAKFLSWAMENNLSSYYIQNLIWAVLGQIRLINDDNLTSKLNQFKQELAADPTSYKFRGKITMYMYTDSVYDGQHTMSF